MTDPRLELGDPTTSAQRLFELAQSNPELGPQIAAHPNAYPGLRDWIAQYAAPAAASAESSTAEALDTLRGQIDALDLAITRLVAERTRLSRRAQQIRISAGGTRVELGRERVIMQSYRAALGADGQNLAEAVLRVGRGQR